MNNQPPRPERTFEFISRITGRATPPSKGGDSYLLNIQSNIVYLKFEPVKILN